MLIRAAVALLAIISTASLASANPLTPQQAQKLVTGQRATNAQINQNVQSINRTYNTYNSINNGMGVGAGVVTGAAAAVGSGGNPEATITGYEAGTITYGAGNKIGTSIYNNVTKSPGH
jgi:hypothetical protein